MNISANRQRVYCHICINWLDIRVQTWLDGDIVRCLKCDAHLGFVWDLPEIFKEEK